MALQIKPRFGSFVIDAACTHDHDTGCIHRPTVCIVPLCIIIMFIICCDVNINLFHLGLLLVCCVQSVYYSCIPHG